MNEKKTKKKTLTKLPFFHDDLRLKSSSHFLFEFFIGQREAIIGRSISSAHAKKQETL